VLKRLATVALLQLVLGSVLSVMAFAQLAPRHPSVERRIFGETQW
jgi:hypothetical protein